MAFSYSNSNMRGACLNRTLAFLYAVYLFFLGVTSHRPRSARMHKIISQEDAVDSRMRPPT